MSVNREFNLLKKKSKHNLYTVRQLKLNLVALLFDVNSGIEKEHIKKELLRNIDYINTRFEELYAIKN